MLLRQDRHTYEGLFAKINEKKLPVIDISLFGLMLSSIDLKKDEPVSLEIFYRNEVLPIWQGLTTVVRSTEIDGQKCTAFETAETPFPINEIQTRERLWSLNQHIQINTRTLNQIPDEAFGIITKSRDYLIHLKNTIDTEFKNTDFTSNEQIEDFCHSAIAVFSPLLRDHFQKMSRTVESYLKTISEENGKVLVNYARDVHADIFYSSAFAKRSYTKPLGYAGDFEMMNIIYRNENLGKTAFERCVEAANLMYEEPQAVRNRVQYLNEKIYAAIENNKGLVKIVSIACGPAREVIDFLTSAEPRLVERVEFTLLDQDETALKDAHKNIRAIAKKRGFSPGVRFIKKNISEIIRRGLDQDYDLAYSAGLFDYFEDNVAKLAAKQILRHSKKVVIGNFDSNSPNPFGMVFLYDWKLILRSAEDLKRIYQDLGSKIEIEKEKAGVNLFCVIEK